MSTLGNVISKSAPILGGIINSFLPGSGLVISGLMSLFGVNTSSDLETTIQNDPEAATKLKQFELTNIQELEKIAAQDRASARNMAIETTKATGKRDNTVSILAFSFVAGFFIYSILLFFVKIDPTVHDIVLLIAGQIATMAITVAGFYFGGMFKTSHSHHDEVLPPPAQTR